MKSWIFACLLAFSGLPLSAAATEQIPDQITIDGQLHELSTLPLDSYIQENKIKLEATCSCNWRGYVAQWEIREGALWLSKVGEPDLDERSAGGKSLAADIFPGKTLPLKAHWYSGTMAVGIGETTNESAMMGFTQGNTEFLLAKVKHGEIVQQRRMSGEAFTALRQQQFEAYRKTDAYEQAYQQSVEAERRMREAMIKKDPDMAQYFLSDTTEEENRQAFDFVSYAFDLEAYLRF